MRVVDLFSGCGGLSLGLEQAGLDVAWAADNWQPAIDTYRANFTHPIEKIDLGSEEALQKIKELNPDAIVGGPPCQDFSIAGKRSEGSRANLTLTFAEIIATIRPRAFVMENVYTITNSQVLPKAEAIIRNAGYFPVGRVLDASRFGVPQARKRFFLIGVLGHEISKAVDHHLAQLESDPMTVREHFRDQLGTDFYYMHPRSYKRRAVFSVDEPSSTIRGVNRPMPQTYQFHPADKSNNRDEIRPLTTQERAQIQTFPKDFAFCGSSSQAEQQIGNAVPVNLARAIGLVLSRTLRDIE